MTRPATDAAADRGPTETGEATTEPIDGEKLLGLLDDDYALDIVAVLCEQSLPARAIADRLDVSRSTVYRRLDRLCEAGVVTTSVRIEESGHHRKEFSVELDRVTLSFQAEGPSVTAHD